MYALSSKRLPLAVSAANSHYGQKLSYYDEQVLNNNQIGAVTGNNLLLLAAEFILFMKIGKSPLSPILIHPPINILGFCENVAHLRG